MMKFSPKREEKKVLIEDIFHGYGPKTLTSGWNYSTESYPWDHPEAENSKTISHYHRLGIFNLPTPPSVMSSDLEAAQRLPRPSRSYRPMVNVVTYPYLFGENRRAAIAKVGLKPPPKGYGCTNYVTTHQASYTNYVEGPMNKPLNMSEAYKPETKFRRLLTDPFNMKRPNLGTFLDDNMDYLKDLRKPVSGPPPYGLDYQPNWIWDMKASE